MLGRQDLRPARRGRSPRRASVAPPAVRRHGSSAGEAPLSSASMPRRPEPSASTGALQAASTACRRGVVRGSRRTCARARRPRPPVTARPSPAAATSTTAEMRSARASRRCAPARRTRAARTAGRARGRSTSAAAGSQAATSSRVSSAAPSRTARRTLRSAARSASGVRWSGRPGARDHCARVPAAAPSVQPPVATTAAPAASAAVLSSGGPGRPATSPGPGQHEAQPGRAERPQPAQCVGEGDRPVLARQPRDPVDRVVRAGDAVGGVVRAQLPAQRSGAPGSEPAGGGKSRTRPVCVDQRAPAGRRCTIWTGGPLG